MSIASKQFANNVATDMFPWYFNNHSTRDGLWFMQHAVIKRSSGGEMIINSPAWSDVKSIFDHFCRENSLTYEHVMRCSINQTHNVGSTLQSDPHVDHMDPHNVFLLYLNDCSGDTIVYNEKFTDLGSESIRIESGKYKELTEMGKFSPKAGQAICFNGDHYHANSFCKDDERRIVCVITFK